MTSKPLAVCQYAMFNIVSDTDFIFLVNRNLQFCRLRIFKRIIFSLFIFIILCHPSNFNKESLIFVII